MSCCSVLLHVKCRRTLPPWVNATLPPPNTYVVRVMNNATIRSISGSVTSLMSCCRCLASKTICEMSRRPPDAWNAAADAGRHCVGQFSDFNDRTGQLSKTVQSPFASRAHGSLHCQLTCQFWEACAFYDNPIWGVIHRISYGRFCRRDGNL